MIGNKGPFPEHESAHQGFEDNGFIKSSQSVGAGHEEGGDRLNGGFDWPEGEPPTHGLTGEGVDGKPRKSGTPHPFNE